MEQANDDEDEDMEGSLTPYDERDQGNHEQGGVNPTTKKNKIPFSFLMHHYLKTNAGKQAATKNPNVGVIPLLLNLLVL